MIRYKMPYSIVLTNEGPSNLISIVPSTWVKDSTLFWPRVRKITDIDTLRRNETSEPSPNWRKLKCKVKASGIETFAEGIKVEQFYSELQNTEDEERYKDTNEYMDLILINKMSENEFSLREDTTKKISISCQNSETETNEIDNTTNFPDAGQTTDENLVTLTTKEFKQIMAENSNLKSENKTLQERLQDFQNLERETQRGFSVIQVQLDKLFDLLKENNNLETASCRNITPIFAINHGDDDDDDIAKKNIEFPIKSIDQLDLLEDQLTDFQFEKTLIQKFSKVCGTSGTLKISKIGLQLAQHMFTDELLYQVTWKGIKGCTKVPFQKYVKIRFLFFKIVRQADSTCSVTDSDLFLQNSAIKHSGQRIKRKSSTMNTSNPKKRKEISEMNNSNDDDVTACASKILESLMQKAG